MGWGGSLVPFALWIHIAAHAVLTSQTLPADQGSKTQGTTCINPPRQSRPGQSGPSAAMGRCRQRAGRAARHSPTTPSLRNAGSEKSNRRINLIQCFLTS